MTRLTANALPLLVGSSPLRDHDAATRLMFEYTPDVPLWIQLTAYPNEGMVAQFVDGLPGLTVTEEKMFLDTASAAFESEVLAFFEDYIAVTESGADLAGSRFMLPEDKRKGFDALMRYLSGLKRPPYAIKGQVTGPVTFGTRMTDQNGRSIFYDDQLRDMAVKKLAMNAAWQAGIFSEQGSVPVIFIDEPVLAGLGTSAYITISREAVTQSIEEIAGAIHEKGGLAGVHVCANTEWDLLLKADIDVISFDAYTYFDRFVLYPEDIRAFIDKGGLLAWGIIPTLSSDDIKKESVESLLARFQRQAEVMADIGIPRHTLLQHCFIAPSCGTGPLTPELAEKVLVLTRELSVVLREDG